jgi:hypothetical protein
MIESTMDNQVLLRRTLVTAGTMVGGCVLIVGTLTLVALAIVGHVVSPAEGAASGDAGAPTATSAHAKSGAAVVAPTTAKAK